MNIEEIRKNAPSDATHYGYVSGCLMYFSVINGHCFYNGKPWLHATVMKIKPLY